MIEEDYNTQGFKCLQGEYINTAAYTVQQVHTMQKKATGNTELLTDKMTDIYLWNHATQNPLNSTLNMGLLSGGWEFQ